MTTAFQSNAFQNDAFQIDNVTSSTSTTGAGSQGANAKYWKWRRERKYRYKKRVKQPDYIRKIVKEYNELAKEIKNDQNKVKILISTVDPYLWPINAEEMNRRMTAQYLVTTPPPANRVDFLSLFGNALAIEKFHANVKKIRDENKRIIQERLEFQYNEDSDMMIMFLAAI